MAESQGGFLTAEAQLLPVDAGLLERFLEAEKAVVWQRVGSRPTPKKVRGRRTGKSGSTARSEAGARLAYYHDETARIERCSVGSEEVLTVTSGPVGALVLVGECHRRGVPTSLETRKAGDAPEFPDGAIEARWDAHSTRPHHALPFADVVKLARYALS